MSLITDTIIINNTYEIKYDKDCGYYIFVVNNFGWIIKNDSYNALYTYLYAKVKYPHDNYFYETLEVAFEYLIEYCALNDNENLPAVFAARTKLLSPDGA